jgi:hypothetical protein
MFEKGCRLLLELGRLPWRSKKELNAPDKKKVFYFLKLLDIKPEWVLGPSPDSMSLDPNMHFTILGI